MGTSGSKKKPSTTESTTVRLSISVKTRIGAAVKKGGKNMSREIEARLSRSFADEFAVADQFGDRQILAVARLVFAAAKATVSRGIGNDQKVVKLTKDLPPRRPAVSWLNDPAAYDVAVAAMNEMLALIRPAGAVGKPKSRPGAIEPAPDVVTAPDQPAGVTYQPAFNAEELVREIATAPPVAPARASRHVLATVALRKDLGDAVLDRAGGVRARARSTWAKEYGALRRKQAKAPDTITNEELQRMRALEAEAERMLR
jgi:hypothetical protein